MKTFTLAEFAVQLHKAYEAGQDNARTRILAHVQDRNNPIGSRSMKELCATRTNFDTACPDLLPLQAVERLLISAATQSVEEECSDIIDKVFER